MYLIIKILYIIFYNITIREYKLFYLEKSLSNYYYLILNIIQILKI